MSYLPTSETHLENMVWAPLPNYGTNCKACHVRNCSNSWMIRNSKSTPRTATTHSGVSLFIDRVDEATVR